MLGFRLLSWHLLRKAEFDRYLLMLSALNLSRSVEWKWDCGRTGEGVKQRRLWIFSAVRKIAKSDY
jgi:hypothetical protein